MSLINENKEAQTFMERSMPLLTHFQLSEALSHLAESDNQQEALKKFEIKKLEEIYEFV